MAIESWEERYRAHTAELRAPDDVLAAAVRDLTPGSALDLACGAGRNALWLAQHGWSVTAVDGSPSAIETLRTHAASLGVAVDTKVADLERHDYGIEPARWDLIAICYYLQRDLFEQAKQGVVPGGLLVTIALMAEPGKEKSPYRMRPGELRAYFDDWDVLTYRESADVPGAAAALVARRPLLS